MHSSVTWSSPQSLDTGEDSQASLRYIDFPIVTTCTKADSHATLGHIKDSLSWYWPDSLLCSHLYMESLTWLVWFQMLRMWTCTTPLTCTHTTSGSALLSKKAMEPSSVVLDILKRPLHLKWRFCLKKKLLNDDYQCYYYIYFILIIVELIALWLPQRLLSYPGNKHTVFHAVVCAHAIACSHMSITVPIWHVVKSPKWQHLPSLTYTFPFHVQKCKAQYILSHLRSYVKLNF